MNRRVPSRAKVALQLGGESRGGLAKDISEGGLFLHTAAPVIVGNRLDLSIELPGSSTISASVEVLRRDDTRDGFGLRFLELRADHRQAIRTYVASVA